MSSSTNASTFWKGVTSLIKAIKFGYRWMVGDGVKIRFWEDTWIGTAPLDVQYWDLYLICMETNVSVKTVWDGNNLKITFRRSVTPQMMEKWYELVEIAKSITFSGVYSTSSLYSVINFWGVQPVHIPAVWKLSVPPRIHIFL